MRDLLRREGLEDVVEVDSAGIGGWHAGQPPDERATRTAAARGVTLDGAARQVARGKDVGDKRQAIKERELKREMERSFRR